MTATHQGLPVSIKIADREMRRDMAGLAAELTELCQGAAMVSESGSAQSFDEGMDADIVGAMGLPTSDDLADFERRTERTDGRRSDELEGVVELESRARTQLSRCRIR